MPLLADAVQLTVDIWSVMSLGVLIAGSIFGGFGLLGWLIRSALDRCTASLTAIGQGQADLHEDVRGLDTKVQLLAARFPHHS